jgi:hypothetical protein
VKCLQTQGNSPVTSRHASVHAENSLSPLWRSNNLQTSANNTPPLIIVDSPSPSSPSPSPIHPSDTQHTAVSHKTSNGSVGRSILSQLTLNLGGGSTPIANGVGNNLSAHSSQTDTCSIRSPLSDVAEEASEPCSPMGD